MSSHGNLSVVIQHFCGKKEKALRKMNHQALFNAKTGICEEGP